MNQIVPAVFVTVEVTRIIGLRDCVKWVVHLRRRGRQSIRVGRSKSYECKLRSFEEQYKSLGMGISKEAANALIGVCLRISRATNERLADLLDRGLPQTGLSN